ncbi:MAG: SufD family Fe-S cluster assembly protein [Tenericutes bacterium]|nr:SufD family Fe-S cluster assembly protein [Mycoplasmatota bacterium]
MKIPKYLQDKISVILLNEKEELNQSKYEITDNLITLHSIDNVYLFIGDYHQSKIELDILSGSNIQLYMIFKSSKQRDYEFKFNIHESAQLDVFTDIRNIEKVKVSLKRIFNLEKDSTLNINNALLNIGETILFDEVNLNNEFAEVSIDQLNIGSYNDVFKVNQDIKHNAKSTKSQINNSLICNSTAKLKYSVSGYIFKGNELSVCDQDNKGIILSEFGEIEVEPKLFIDEYNVEASHGAAIGQIDEEQLYYLLSRGLSEMQARSLIISGYTKPFINKIQDEDIKLMVERQILKKINEGDIV